MMKYLYEFCLELSFYISRIASPQEWKENMVMNPSFIKIHSNEFIIEMNYYGSQIYPKCHRSQNPTQAMLPMMLVVMVSKLLLVLDLLHYGYGSRQTTNSGVGSRFGYMLEGILIMLWIDNIVVIENKITI